MDWSVLILLLALMLAPLMLAVTAIFTVVLSQRARSRWVLLGALLPQSLMIALMLWPGGLKVVEFSSEILMWLVTLITWLTLFLARWQRRGTPPIPALVTSWLLFIVLAAAFYFNPSNQSTMAWKRHEQQMQHNLVLLEQGLVRSWTGFLMRVRASCSIGRRQKSTLNRRCAILSVVASRRWIKVKMAIAR